jgi:hypothetical protein
VACGPSTPNCYTNLPLAAPQLFGTAAATAPHIPSVTPGATAPFVGNTGNQVDGTIYQPGARQTVADQMAAINNLVTANAGQSNYFTANSTTLASSYGDSSHPAIVVFTDSTLSLQSATASLSGYGVLVVSNALEIGNGGTLNWNGIVLINSSTGHVTVSSSANGSVNGALLLAPGAVFNLSNSASTAPSFQVKYSCEAIDLAFTMQPFKVISTAETSF